MVQESDNSKKHDRVLEIYSRLLNGDILVKEDLAEEFGTSQKSIQRDIEAIRDFYSNRTVKGEGHSDVIYDRKVKGYRLISEKTTTLTNAELFAITKILMDSRSLSQEEMKILMGKLVDATLPASEKKMMKELTGNELYHYVEPRHGKNLVNNVWELGKAITRTKVVKLEYMKADGEKSIRLVKPVAIMNSEFYFYLIAYIGDNDKKHPGFPTVFRIDRIISYKITDESFLIPYRERFEEGEFRKRVQFMYSGKLYRAKFIYTGSDINAILDRLPTAKATKQKDGSYEVIAEVFGEKGFRQWIGGQENCEITG